MMEKAKNVIDSSTRVPISLIITLVVMISGLFAFGYNERSERLIWQTRFENHISDPNIHHQGFAKMQEQVEINKAMLSEIKSIKMEIRLLKEQIDKLN